MSARISAILVWALVALSATFWGSRFLVVAPVKPASSDVPTRGEPPQSAFTRLFGESASATVAAVEAQPARSRFQLSGVVAPIRPGGSGIALIAIDGKRAGAYLVGATIDGDVVLKSVSLRGATLVPANGAPAIVLELPLRAPPATGVLQAAADEIEPTPAVELVQEAPLGVQAPPKGLSPGRRQRLRRLDTAPTDNGQATR